MGTGQPFGNLNVQIRCSLVSAELAVLPSFQGDLVVGQSFNGQTAEQKCFF